MARIVRIWIDERVCLDDGFCAQECPEVFVFDDASPIPKIKPDTEQLYALKEEKIRAAVDICPYNAIHIEEVETIS
jgi:ferredoxin